MERHFNEKVVVITGASSGIGRAAALAFAREGASVVLNSRQQHILDEIAEECRHRGGKAMAFAADVTDEGAVRDLAEMAILQFGKIDVWVNNAAVTMFGRTEEVPYEDYRRVIETNFFGYLHGARAVIPRFREQGYGTLINVSSVIGKYGSPYVGAYSTSKFAINGLSEVLRAELHDAPDIQVCTLLPASIDTPLFQHGANFSGRAVKPLDPVIRADDVADAILSLARHPRRQLTVGASGVINIAMHAISPPLAERVIAHKVETDHFRQEPAAPSHGNLFEPSEDVSISGGWHGAHACYPMSKTRKYRALAAVGLAGLALLALSRRSDKKKRGG